MRNLYFFLLLNLFAFQAIAQNAAITGKVVQQDSNEPLIGATVVLSGTTKGSITDLDGNFTIPNLSPGSYTLRVSYVGYETIENFVTLDAGETEDLGRISLTVSAVGLSEVQIFASVVEEDRKTPVAISSINADQIQERFEGASLAQIAQNTPGVYAIQGAGGYGDEEVYIRGFDQSNVAFLINGIPVNDMENGRMFWSNFAGLDEVTRQMQVQRGLGASKLAISSIGGTVNMISSPAERREGGKIEYQFGTGSWNERLRFTYNTGVSENGWAATFQGSRTKTNGGLIGRKSLNEGSVVPGAYTDAWSYYLAISKTINEQHQIQFWGFGAPVDRGTAWTVDDRTREAFDIDDVRFNNALGIYQGELLNARQNKLHKPLMALSHFWDIDSETNITTSVYYSFANVYSTQPTDMENSLFLNNRAPGMPELTHNNLINFDYLAAQNRDPERLLTIENPNNDPFAPPVTGYASRYYLQARYNNHNWIGMISNFRKQFDRLSFTGGIDLRHYKGEHYAKVHELFGGDFVLNQAPRFGDVYNLLESSVIAPNTGDDIESNDFTNDIAREGDKVNYNYDGNVNWAAVFAQGEYSLDKFDIFATATLAYSSYYRVGKFWSGRNIYRYNSYGKSATENFLTYTLKAGVNYRPNNRHNIYVNGGVFTRPPFFSDAFADARYSNQYRQGLDEENIYSLEAGYGYRTGSLQFNFNTYYTVWKDRTTTFNADNADFGLQQDDVYIPAAFPGLESLHRGLEFDVRYDITSNLELNGYVSLGDWEWNKNPVINLETPNAQGELVYFSDTLQIAGFPVGTTAQTTAGAGFHYTGIRSMYLGGRFNYADRIAVRFLPEDILQGYISETQIKDAFDDYYTLDIYVGRYFDVSDAISGRISASVQNITNTEYVRWAAFFDQQFQRGFGYPRTYTIALQLTF